MAGAGVRARLHRGGQEGAGAVGRLERPPGHAALRRRGRSLARLADHPPLAGMPLSIPCRAQSSCAWPHGVSSANLSCLQQRIVLQDGNSAVESLRAHLCMGQLPAAPDSSHSLMAVLHTAVQGEAEGRQVWLHLLRAHDERGQGRCASGVRLQKAT